MKKSLFICTVLTVFSVSSSWSQGFLSSIRGRFGGDAPNSEQVAQQQPVASTPAPAESGSKNTSGKTVKNGKTSVKIVEGTPPSAVSPQATPDKETIRKGAARLKNNMVQERVPGNLFDLYSGTWKGTINIYSAKGDVLESHAAEVVCRPSGGTMVKETYFIDRDSKQPILASTANYVNDGSAVKIVSSLPDGSSQQSSGHYNDRQLFIVSLNGNRLTHSRERLADGNRMLIDGFDYNAGNTKVTVGRLTRQR